MEVGYEGIHRLELVAGVDEDGGLTVYRVHLAVGGAYTFKNSAGGSAYGYDSAALGTALVYLACNLVGDVEVLTVHKVLLDLVDLYGTEGSKTYVKCNLAVADALSPDALEKLGGKMKSCGGSGCRALLLSVYGLVIALVLEPLGDIGRQGHIAYRVEHLVYGLIFLCVVVESDYTVATVDNVCDGSLKYAAEVEGRADLSSLAGANERLPLAAVEHAEEQKLHGCTCLFGNAEKSCGDNLRRVNDKHILGVKVIYDVAKDLVVDSLILSVKHHKAAHISLCRGELRDELLWEVVVEIVCGESSLYSVVYNGLIKLFHRSSHITKIVTRT